ncbi:BZ3500_MvSof-1268-A1-R1_Chr8-1g09988 [Microbotryum saponariae]|uniref:BZ3500_MvSof-1268-A1-R1_Chr8-1g09988 protein n=1 Tax=Microbotryum saponariae TaxID=289078 RepID=A0A2X0KW61_9BASI|nr:BZ3500_MvSof-1268-A1-R1_Chr8-1g09988 [Microbotryum saponariae]SDA08274.1 BZ3501_MvSof-1269-A2-R1_Chr8-1g09711 [Microbotryum saponariae]
MPSSAYLTLLPIRSNTDPTTSPRTTTPQAALHSSARSSLSDVPHASYDLSMDYGPQDDGHEGGEDLFSSNQSNDKSPERPGRTVPSRTGRGRARALSIACSSPHLGKRNGDDAERSASDDEAYSYALRPEEEAEDEEDDEIDGLEMTRLSSTTTSTRESQRGDQMSNKRKDYLRSRFQPLTYHEMGWMGVTALVVLVLSAAAVVLAAIG